MSSAGRPSNLTRDVFPVTLGRNFVLATLSRQIYRTQPKPVELAVPDREKVLTSAFPSVAEFVLLHLISSRTRLINLNEISAIAQSFLLATFFLDVVVTAQQPSHG